MLPAKTYALKKNACIVNDIGFFGARGGDFAPLTRYGDKRSQADIDKALDKEERELQLSLDDLNAQVAARGEGYQCRQRICLFHYPPVPSNRSNQRFSQIIQSSGADCCIYGHLHGSESQQARIEGDFQDIHYHCTSCDLIGFEPKLISEHQ